MNDPKDGASTGELPRSENETALPLIGGKVEEASQFFDGKGGRATVNCNSGGAKPSIRNRSG
ncbi:MAG: hypothetical protein D6728_18515 [Cyanobacteria bacterium J055]|nr:MAG: hypothetical protein D6728_18515 [Cyanobacteria bacterium J055]